ncbi:hypothetical protein Pcinc_041784 [Petrolisthes cinctipes]|uniref:Uncharacterized protein n=1 Tax=Petrolisthes cinctipes TaxID=88211 RepID=A0AAE1BIV2_PETCI|nr:hypothetical protein Pcinc_041784 [Petrolisthes cinctipes]
MPSSSSSSSSCPSSCPTYWWLWPLMMSRVCATLPTWRDSSSRRSSCFTWRRTFPRPPTSPNTSRSLSKYTVPGRRGQEQGSGDWRERALTICREAVKVVVNWVGAQLQG